MPLSNPPTHHSRRSGIRRSTIAGAAPRHSPAVRIVHRAESQCSGPRTCCRCGSRRRSMASASAVEALRLDGRRNRRARSCGWLARARRGGSGAVEGTVKGSPSTTAVCWSPAELERPPVREVRRDPRRPERVAAHRGRLAAAAASRLIIARTTHRSSARLVSRRPAGSTVWMSGTFGSSSLPAST